MDRLVLILFILYLTNMLGDEEEVKPVPLGNSMVQHSSRGRVVRNFPPHCKDPCVDPLGHHYEAKAWCVVC